MDDFRTLTGRTVDAFVGGMCARPGEETLERGRRPNHPQPQTFVIRGPETGSSNQFSVSIGSLMTSTTQAAGQ